MVWWTCSYVHVRVVRSGKIEHQESRLVLIMCNLGTWSNLLFEETLQYATLPSKSQTSPLCVCWSNESQSLRKTRGKAEAAATPLLKDMALVSELGPLKKYEILYDYRGIKGLKAQIDTWLCQGSPFVSFEQSDHILTGLHLTLCIWFHIVANPKLTPVKAKEYTCAKWCGSHIC